VRVESVTVVQDGQVLVVLANPELVELRYELQALERAVRARRAAAWARLPAVLQPLDQRLASITAQLIEIEDQLVELEVRAPQAGVWSAPLLETRLGVRVPRGALLGRLRSGDDLMFEAVVAQRDVDRFNRSARRLMEVRLRGTAATAHPAGPGELRPAESRVLPSPALGWSTGGTVPTDPEDPEGRRALEPFFRLEVPLPEDEVADLFLRTGVLRVGLDWQPWGVQAWRRVRQLIQVRYGR
jgi:putative peptide zinc metalloprotease protein